jgi:hypothetical protein
MSVVQWERDHFRARWRRLVRAAKLAAIDPDALPGELKEHARDAVRTAWLPPTDRPGQIYAFGAFAGLADAMAHQPTMQERRELAASVLWMAEWAEGVLNASEPAEPERRHRADIDD